MHTIFVEGHEELPPMVVWLKREHRNTSGGTKKKHGQYHCVLKPEHKVWCETHLKGAFESVRVVWPVAKKPPVTWKKRPEFAHRYGLKFERETDMVIYKMFAGETFGEP